jgi:nucleotide-binding universal stress UspA family protein
MTTPSINHQHRRPVVIVVGIDLSDVSVHLMNNARDLIRSAKVAELHLVHVIHPESVRSRLTEPISTKGGPESRAHIESAQWQLERVRASIVGDSGVEVRVHTPVGEPAEQIARIAQEVGADLVLVEAHDRASPGRMFHRSVVARIARKAPCSVLTSRPKGDAQRTVGETLISSPTHVAR